MEKLFIKVSIITKMPKFKVKQALNGFASLQVEDFRIRSTKDESSPISLYAKYCDEYKPTKG